MAAVKDTTVLDDEADDAADGEPSVFQRRPWLGPLLIGLLVAGAAFGLWRWVDYRNHGRYVQTTNDAYVRADAVTVASKLAGYVAGVDVADNQRVATGAPLATIDPTDYRTRIEQAEAQIGAARAADEASES